jgi:hypothetical protein
MNTWMTNAEVQMVVAEKLHNRKRERISLTPNRGPKLRDLARAVMSLIF